MKSATAYYLLLLYLTVMFKPLIPLAADAWSHAFNKQKHLSTIHAQQGKDHVEMELAAKGTEENSKEPKNAKSETENNWHLTALSCNAGLTFSYLRKAFTIANYPDPSPVYLQKQGPPPRFS